jgi:FkbM family methyltransferase
MEIQAELFADARVIFDLGANVGQTAKQYRSHFPRAHIYSFEPFHDSFAALQQALWGDPNFHPQMIALAVTL